MVLEMVKSNEILYISQVFNLLVKMDSNYHNFEFNKSCVFSQRKFWHDYFRNVVVL